ncbi:unnamed protein product [Pseudo-nitzschia multistriata]|uniref:Fe2OG dioxygenase domain-containing protein n=1 Tax=Pseudo-nitzschia multistriata TaxID=183589 RepID=A0A448ZQD5_9STRA|nr:unnamed protein product [Pseudo-nitzschia multistriata]
MKVHHGRADRSAASARTIGLGAIFLVLLGAVHQTRLGASATPLCGNGDADGSPGECRAVPLRPSDIPPPSVFDSFGANRSVTVPPIDESEDNGESGGTTLSVLPGSIKQQGKHLASNETPSSDLVVLPGLLPRPVVAEMLALLRGHEDADFAVGKTTIVLDADPDSVDGMTSQEFFLDNDSLRSGGSSKGNPNENMEERRDLRAKLRALTDRYAYDTLVPFLEQWYGKDTCGRPGRRCTPCYSLIRRYRAGERQSHAPHHDAHSFVTVVVSLTDYGREYNGGLYVSTKNSERNYVKLNRGDAVAHQGYLHHGVKVLDQRDDGGPSERWSWIMWFRDSDTCEEHNSEWHRSCAEKGNPTCMYLRASTEPTEEGVVHWNTMASKAGHSQASVKLAYANLKMLPSRLIEFNQDEAERLFEEAIASSNEPDGHYGKAMLYLTDTKKSILEQPTNEAKAQAAWEALGSETVKRAIWHLEEAAKGGHVFAMFNLGIASTYGYGSTDGTRDFELAIEWFEASGMPEGFFAKSMYLGMIGKTQEAEEFQKRAATLGYGQPWRKVARERTGSGGSGGVTLNLPWPPLPTGETPPEW